MARDPDALSNMDLLVLSSLARLPMHGYELELELRYRHVRWWARCEHSHLYATLLRLERKKLIAPVKAPKAKKKPQARAPRVYQVTPLGHRRVREVLLELGSESVSSYFEIDLFLSGSFLLPQADVVSTLERRTRRIEESLTTAEELRSAMSDRIPVAGRLIIDHRIQFLKQELRFLRDAKEAVAAERTWGPFLGQERITEFLRRTGVDVEA